MVATPKLNKSSLRIMKDQGGQRGCAARVQVPHQLKRLALLVAVTSQELGHGILPVLHYQEGCNNPEHASTHVSVCRDCHSLSLVSDSSCARCDQA